MSLKGAGACLSTSKDNRIRPYIIDEGILNSALISTEPTATTRDAFTHIQINTINTTNNAIEITHVSSNSKKSQNSQNSQNCTKLMDLPNDILHMISKKIPGADGLNLQNNVRLINKYFSTTASSGNVTTSIMKQFQDNIYDTLCSDILPCIYYNMQDAISRQAPQQPGQANQANQANQTIEISYNFAIIFKNQNKLIIFTVGIMNLYTEGVMKVELFDEQGVFKHEVPYIFEGNITDLKNKITYEKDSEKFINPAELLLNAKTGLKKLVNDLMSSFLEAQPQLFNENSIIMSYALSYFDYTAP